ncbi:MAG: lipase chaperone, partial [Byssovorax sp.]
MDSERKPGRARGILVLAAALLLASGARRLHAEATPPPARSTPARAEIPARAAAPAAAKPSPARVAPAVAAPADQGPSSLRGTDEDGSLAADESGNLVVGPGILAFFDYHLSATGEL